MLHAPNRGDFIAGAGAMVVAFSLAKRDPANAQGFSPATNMGKPETLDDVDSFLALYRDGTVAAYTGRVDLGTGIRTALTQIVAEELDVPLDRVTLIQGDTALTPDQGITYASISIQIIGMAIRQAAATARAALVKMAGDRLGVAGADLNVKDGVVRSAAGKSVSYAELIGGRSFSLKVDKTAPVKKPAAYTKVGRSVKRLDIPDKVTGRYTYMQDVRVPGMLHGRVIRPHGIGAKVVAIDESSVASIPGFVKVVRDDEFLGVVARTEWAAIKAARKLKVTWSKWDGLPDESRLWEHVRATKVVRDDVTSNVGDASAALAQTSRKLSASYDFAIHTHGSIGPSCAVAYFTGDKLTVWTAAQSPHALRKQLAQMLKMPESKVRCIYVEGSGCYGRNGHEDAAADAALLARAVGKPVRVQWMRADEHGWDPKGVPTLVDLQGALDEAGNVTAWRSEFFIPNGAGAPVMLLAADLAELPRIADIQPGNIFQDSAIPYTFKNVNTICHRLETTPFRPSWIRSPGRMQNTYANEAFLDELAAAAAADPLDFRLKYLADARGVELLKRLATLSKWDTRPSPLRQSGEVLKGRGLAYVKYELVRTYVAAVAHVEVNRRTGSIRVPRFEVVHDCGQIINPDGVKNQIEGCVVQTTSRVLKEQVTFDRSRVTSLDWETYPILKFPDVPDVVIDLIDRPSQPPWGVGEPAAAVVPAAICNAIFDATGIRMRSIPYTPAKTLALLKAQRTT